MIAVMFLLVPELFDTLYHFIVSQVQVTIFRKKTPNYHCISTKNGGKKRKKNQQKSPNNEISSTELQSTLQVNWN